MITKKEVSNATDIIEGLDIMYLIAGGYPRDLAHGVEPKDLDIMVVGDEESFNRLCQKVPFTEKFLSSNSGIDQCDEYDDPFVTGVIKVGPNVDIVMWNVDLFCNPLEVVQFGFDFNINQYIMNKVTDKPTFIGKDLGILKPIRFEELKQSRVSKVVKICEKLGWDSNGQ